MVTPAIVASTSQGSTNVLHVYLRCLALPGDNIYSYALLMVSVLGGWSEALRGSRQLPVRGAARSA